MKTVPVNELLVLADADLRSALRAIDSNGQGVVFVCDPNRRLLGVLTDGDARRAIMGGVELTTLVVDVMNASPIWCSVGTEPEVLLSKLDRRVTHIPLVDDQNRIVDYASPQRLRRIQIASPELTGNELAYLADCVRTGWISSRGEYVREFERQFGAFCGMTHGLAVSNGTAALHLALEALGVGEGDEVILPDLTFAACINVILHAGATPVLVDIDARTWTMDVEQTAAAVTPRTAAIMAVHLYGQPCDLDPLCQIAMHHGIWLIEDCAEAIGGRYKGERVGSFGDASAFSFFGNKTITTGEGGMVLFRDAALADRARRLRDHGMSSTQPYWHEVIGFNYRMTNLQAAVGVAQMERVGEFLTSRRRLSDAYDRGLEGLPGIELRRPVPWSESVCWLYSLLITDEAAMSRDDLIQELNLVGIETRPLFYPLHEMPPYKALAGTREFPVARDIGGRGLSLPSAVSLSDDEIDFVIGAIQGVTGRHESAPVS